jgi:hypothetical protein
LTFSKGTKNIEKRKEQRAREYCVEYGRHVGREGVYASVILKTKRK